MNIKQGYKQTEIGIIPEDWEVSKVQHQASVIDSLHSTPSFSDDGYSMVRVTDIKTGNLSLNDALKVSKNVFDEFTRNYKPKRNDIVVSRVGSYGVSSFVETNEPFCMGQNTVVIDSKLPPRFLYYVLNSTSTQQQIEGESYGSGYKSLSLRNIKELSIPIPPKQEQTAIATALSDIDALIGELDKLIAKKQGIKQAIMQQLLTGKKRLAGFSGEWEVKRLGDVADIIGGGTPSTFVSNYWNGNINWFTPTEIGTEKYVFDSVRKITKDGLINCSAKILPIGTILLTTRAGIGDISILKKEACTNQGFQSFVTKDSFYNEFLYYLISTLKNVLIQNASGSTFLEISPNKIKQIQISIPTIEEQTAIATILSDMDAEISQLEGRRAKMGELKQGMMQELLTGRIRLI
jgi:type I restriction enzyme S subunit